MSFRIDSHLGEGKGVFYEFMSVPPARCLRHWRSLDGWSVMMHDVVQISGQVPADFSSAERNSLFPPRPSDQVRLYYDIAPIAREQIVGAYITYMNLWNLDPPR